MRIVLPIRELILVGLVIGAGLTLVYAVKIRQDIIAAQEQAERLEQRAFLEQIERAHNR